MISNTVAGSRHSPNMERRREVSTRQRRKGGGVSGQPRKEYRQREQRVAKEEGVVLKEEGRRRQHIDGKDRGDGQIRLWGCRT